MATSGDPTKLFNVEAERKTLGAIIRDRDAFCRAAELIASDAFYQPNHALIFKAVADLHEKNKPVDLVSLAELLKRRNKLEVAGGSYYLVECVQSVATSANVEYHATVVRDLYVRRALVQSVEQIKHQCMESEDDTSEITSYAMNSLFALSQKADTGRHGLKHVSQLVDQTIDGISAMIERGKQKGRGGAREFSFGFYDLDKVTGGFDRGDLIILGARKSTGKTALAIQIAERIGRNEPVAFFTMEMSDERIVRRQLLQRAQISTSDINQGDVSKDDIKRLFDEAQWVSSNTKVYLDQESNLSTNIIRARVERLRTQLDSIGLIIVDYFQQLKVDSSAWSGVDAYNRNVRALKIIAKETQTPVLLLAQLNRAAEELKDGEAPSSYHLKDCGRLEEEADLVLLMYRDNENPNSVRRIKIEKNRDGEIGDCALTWTAKYMQFSNHSSRNKDEYGCESEDDIFG